MLAWKTEVISQFFINVKKKDFLNFTSKTETGWGYAVFGKVTKCHGIVNKIKAVPAKSVGGHDDVPASPVTILYAEIVEE